MAAVTTGKVIPLFEVCGSSLWRSNSSLRGVCVVPLSGAVIPLFEVCGSMVALQLPDGCGHDEYGTDGTWLDLTVIQGMSLIEIDRSSIEEGDCLAFLDRNSFAEQVNRYVFVLFAHCQ